MGEISYDVRVYKTQVRKGQGVTSHRVRWRTGAKLWSESFRNRAQGESLRAELLSAARRGEAFSLATGKPTSWERQGPAVTWYDFTCGYVDMKWKAAAAKYRRAIAQALTAAMPAMLDAGGGPSLEDIRAALLHWGYNTRIRAQAPDDAARVLTWLSRNTRPVGSLAEPARARDLLDAAVTRLDGRRAAATSVRRNRAVLFNALEYAVELGLLHENPLKYVRWRMPRASHEVDRRSVVNPTQARALLMAVGRQQPSGPCLVAFFGVMYYSGLRPEEAVNLREHNVVLPALEWHADRQDWARPEDAWGELHVGRATPDAGRRWTDDGSERDSRYLKHRAEGETRRVPCPPELTRLLRAHLDNFGAGPDGLLFRGVQGRPLATVTYRRAWDKARRAALSAEQYDSPLARRVYDLRHACLSTWLNAGVAPRQVAEWAGHSVEMLLRIYAKCLEGDDRVGRQRIYQALQM